MNGDTSRFKDEEELKHYDLLDFRTSNHEFSFRFWSNYQIIEITKDSSKIEGTLTNFIKHKKYNFNSYKIIYKKQPLPDSTLKNIIEYIQKENILNIPSYEQIENWLKVSDAIVYNVEYADKSNYWYKRYSSPISQDSVQEAIAINLLIDTLSKTFYLKEAFDAFYKSLPKTGCFYSGGMVSICKITNSFSFGYSGALKLPLGFYAEYNAGYIGKKKIGFGTAINYYFDKNGFYHLQVQAAKSINLLKKMGFSDYLNYSFEQRKLNDNKQQYHFQNHLVKYGINLKSNYDLEIGADLLKNRETSLVQTGVFLNASKWFKQPMIGLGISSSVFKNFANYKLNVSKGFNTRNKLIDRSTLSIDYENFKSYKDLYLTYRVSIY